jgi:NADPH:quinone reductase-like Zn-dependent oxidoreductase
MLRLMRSIWITRHGGPEVLAVRETPDPVPGPGEVRVRVKAAGLNFADVMARLGLYQDAPPTPCVVGYEAAGVVDAVGPGTSGPGPGERVVVITRFGGQSDTVVVPAHQALPMPEGLGFEEAAALPVNYLTAYHMLFTVGHLPPGGSVLVHTAAGGVGIAALQLARTVPGVTILGTASAAKHAVLREEGCQHPIDPRAADYAEEVRRVTGGRGVDLVLDALGGADWRKGYRLLRPAGMLVAFGWTHMASGERRNLLNVARQFVSLPRFSPLQLMEDNRGVAGVNLLHLWGETERMRGEFRAVLDLCRRGSVRPRIDGTFPFDRAADAHRRLQSRQSVGKILLVP